MLVKDEEDIVGYTVRHLLGQVDQVLVADNMSTDRTPEILREIQVETADDRLLLGKDVEVGYYQDRKTTALAMKALSLGHRWVVPCDADEFWYATDGRTISDFLAGVGPDVQIVDAPVFNHLPSALDHGEEANPFARICFRQREHGMKKVAARLRPDLRIAMGNHDAFTDGTAIRGGGLVVRHFSWRSAQQYVRKIRNGAAAYAATDLPEGFGVGWRSKVDATDEALVSTFYEWFYLKEPDLDTTIIYDPAPGA